MRKLLKFFIPFFITIFCFKVSYSQKIDTAPLDAYWKLTELLKHGDSLSVDDWNAFLNIEPNKIYMDDQGFDSSYLERLRKTIQYVYMPKYDSLLAVRVAAIDKDPSVYWMTYKVYVYKKYESELKEYEKQILDPAYLDSIYKHTFAWLPKRLQKKDTAVQMHFLGIENDAIAGGGTIIATFWQIYNQDKLRLGILGGHEMHHVLRKKVEFNNVSENEKGIIYALNGVLNEGTADLIDKTYNIAHDEELPMGCRFKDFELSGADSIVNQIDSSIIAMAMSNGKIFRTEKNYRDLLKWSSGHCPGYYMADIIVRNGFKKQLLDNIQNPFAFIYLYNKAAKKDRGKPHVFSKRSVDYVKSLEEKYWMKK